ncbi:hypothetical protein Gorai_021359, partial [Gossypium raimondii]|nr:hypothetical protein [Gossypium raimondii]
MGHIKDADESCQDSGTDRFAWTYTSQEFEMAQENRLQTFKLPEPILCIGGILQIELLSRVQRQEIDGLFYICVSHVQVVGRPLSPAFSIQILEPPEKFVLEVQSYSLPTLPEQMSSITSLQMRVRDLEQILNLLQGNGGEVEYGYEWEVESDEDEE